MKPIAPLSCGVDVGFNDGPQRRHSLCDIIALRDFGIEPDLLMLTVAEIVALLVADVCDLQSDSSSNISRNSASPFFVITRDHSIVIPSLVPISL
jgi:hypothetical protein